MTETYMNATKLKILRWKLARMYRYDGCTVFKVLAVVKILTKS